MDAVGSSHGEVGRVPSLGSLQHMNWILGQGLGPLVSVVLSSPSAQLQMFSRRSIWRGQWGMGAYSVSGGHIHLVLGMCTDVV